MKAGRTKYRWGIFYVAFVYEKNDLQVKSEDETKIVK